MVDNNEISNYRLEKKLIFKKFRVGKLIYKSNLSTIHEGINELKTRELAQKYGIKIAAYGYPKETEVAKTLQEVIGKDVMDKLAFIKINKRREFLIEKVGIEKADLYKRVFKDMILLSDEFLKKMENISDPYAKAGEYKKISYAEVLEYIDEYIEKTK